MASRVASAIDYTDRATRGMPDVVARLGMYRLTCSWNTRSSMRIGQRAIGGLIRASLAGKRLDCIRPSLPSRRAAVIGLVPRPLARPGGPVTA